MTLGEAPLGQSLTVVRVGGDRAFRRRLMELGLLPGTAVEVVRVAPLGDPIELSVRGCLLSIRREEAARIEIVSVTDATRALAEARPGDQSSSPPLKRAPDGPSVPAAS